MNFLVLGFLHSFTFLSEIELPPASQPLELLLLSRCVLSSLAPQIMTIKALYMLIVGLKCENYKIRQ